jgi:hypothetical protein
MSAEKQSPSSANKLPIPPRTKLPKHPGTNAPSTGLKGEISDTNIIPVTLDKLTAEQRQELEKMVSSVAQAHLKVV